MKQFGGLALIAALFAGSVAADPVLLQFNPYGSVVQNSYDGVNFTSTVVASVSEQQTGELNVPAGALTIEHVGSYYDSWNQAEITTGYGAFESSAASDVVLPFHDLLMSYMGFSFDDAAVQTYSVFSASNQFWNFDASAEANGSTDYGSNHVAFQLSRTQLVDSMEDPLGATNTTIYQQFNFLISLADLPASAADITPRTADDVRALFAELNGHTGYFYSTVGFQIDRCEVNSCWQTGFTSWQVAGQITAQGTIAAVPVPATVLLLALGLPLLRRRKQA